MMSTSDFDWLLPTPATKVMSMSVGVDIIVTISVVGWCMPKQFLVLIDPSVSKQENNNASLMKCESWTDSLAD
jgi:hypothetical protein